MKKSSFAYPDPDGSIADNLQVLATMIHTLVNLARAKGVPAEVAAKLLASSAACLIDQLTDIPLEELFDEARRSVVESAAAKANGLVNTCQVISAVETEAKAG